MKASKTWMRLWRSVRMRDVIILSLLPLLVGFYMIGISILDYHSSQQFDDWWSSDSKLDTFFVGRLSAGLNLPKIMALQRRLDPEKRDAGIIHLQVPGELWGSWQADPLALWGQWIDATLVRGNTLYSVKLRKRGDTSVHWSTEKKSFTLKTPRSSLFKGHRELAFSVKSVLNTYLANGLASEFDLLAPFTTVTPIFVNKRFYGIHRVTEVIDESFLRRRGRMPGNIFRGDTAERGEYFKGISRDLFANPYIWDRVAVNDRHNGSAMSMLQAFLFDVNGTSFDDHLRLMSWVDPDEIARLVALMLVVGDPIHITGVHNNFWYADPSSGLLHPIPWDLRRLDLTKRQGKKWHFNRLLSEFLRNPFVVEDALREIHQQLADNRLLQVAEQRVGNIWNRYADHFEYDRLRGKVISNVGSPEEVLHGLRNNIRVLNGWFRDSAIAFHDEIHTADTIIMDFEARGRVGADLHAIELRGDIGTGQSIRLVADRNRNGILDASDPEVPGQWTASHSGGQLTLTTPPTLLPGVDTKELIRPAPIHYRFFLTTAGSGVGRISAVHPHVRNRFTNEGAKIIELRAGDPVSLSPSWHPWQYPSRSSVVHRLSGDVHLRETVRIPKGDTLIIEAGATVRMDPDVSILARGRVVARGSRERPITFRPAVGERPWGSIALQGGGASNSVFEYVRFTGGGGAFLDRIEYKGMVSVHWADKVGFQQCEFSDNARSDDMLNAVHSTVTVNDCTFVRANADAIDFDYSSGEIANSRFEGSRNDAIDLMGSSPKIIGNYITRSADKGISIGEASHPLVFNNYIAHSHRGVEIKDRSEPFLVNNVITQNTIGILQGVKNWRYGTGGWGKLVNTVVADNERDILSDKDSRLTQMGSVVGQGSRTPVAARPSAQVTDESVWIFAHHGIGPRSNTVGLLNGWTPVDATVPKDSATFEDDFEQVADGWVGTGGVSRLEKRDQNLVMTISRRQGHVSRTVNWTLTDPEYTYVAVFELTGRNTESAAISVLSNEEEVTIPFEANESLQSFSFVPMTLKPGHYKAITIAATPGPGTGRVELHTYRLYAIPKRIQEKPGERSLASWTNPGSMEGNR